MSEKPTNLKTLTPEEIAAAYAKQTSDGSWTFSNEREFMENLFCQRFNFLLILYSLIVAACASASVRSTIEIVLIVGFALCSAVTVTVWRAHAKLIVILNICYRIPGHPIAIVHGENQKWPRWHRGIPVNQYLGLWIPIGCCLSLIVAWFAIRAGWWIPLPSAAS